MTKEEYEEERDDLLKQVPERYRAKVARRAWEDGHAYGYREVLNHLEDLVDIFKG